VDSRRTRLLYRIICDYYLWNRVANHCLPYFQTKRAVRIIDGRRAAQMKGIEDQLGKLVKEWRQLESPRFNLKSVG